MKYLVKIPILAVAASLLFLACTSDKNVDTSFSIDPSQVEEKIGPDGGERKITVTTSGKWSATTDAPWVKLLPANGKGAMECTVVVDSSVLADEERTATIQIVSKDHLKPLEFSVVQTGYEKMIKVSEPIVEVPDYGEYGKRTFEIKVITNIEFTVTPPYKSWVIADNPADLKQTLNRGFRPREITYKFKWENNPGTTLRESIIELKPKVVQELAVHDKLTVKQVAAKPIEPGIEGDSLVILACQRTFSSQKYSTGERMRNWPGVIVWESTDKEVQDRPELLGRVRAVRFQDCYTKETFPVQIQYLNEAEEIIVSNNGNAFMLNLSSGEHLCKLTKLKRLRISGFGLTTLDNSFKNLVNLEILDLSGNNFDQIPSVLTTASNLPKLKHINLNSNRRYSSLVDLQIPSVTKENWGGLNKTANLSSNYNLTSLFKRTKLEFLRLSFNCMQGELPEMKNETKYQSGDTYWYIKANGDTVKNQEVPQAIIDMNLPKVLPNLTTFSVNHNFFTGKIPDWMLYHPHFIKWDPYSLIFNQEEGRNENGVQAGFINVPPSPELYYEKYPEQRIE